MVTDSPQTRRVILAAAEEVIRCRGIGCATTRAIAERAGCAEGTIYRHFPDKQTLICEIVQSSFPGFHVLMASLPARAGSGSVRGTLEEVGTKALAFFRAIVPLVAGPLSDQDLLVQQRRYFVEAHAGPLVVFQALTTYLRHEQDLGRISASASPEHVTRLLLGACFGQAFVEALVGEGAAMGSDTEFIAASVGMLLPALDPATARP